MLYRVSFQNAGLIDLVALTTFGVNVKEHANPIGYFGTGLKYALAICARLSCRVRVFRGLERYDFMSREVEVRGKTFEVIAMVHPDGHVQELGFTTELGKTWEPWQCFREFYCNTLDEQGVTSAETLQPRAGYTTIYVDGEPFYRAYLKRGDIVLEGEPQHRLAALNVYARANTHTYFRGVRIHQLEAPALLTYNMLGHLDITEDRTAKHAFQVGHAVRDALLATTDAVLLRTVLTAPAGSWEASHLDFETWTRPGPTFMAIMESLPFAQVTNASARKAYNKHSVKVYAPDPVPLNTIEMMTLDRASEFAQWMGYAVHEYPVIVTADLPELTWGMAYDGRIWLNRSAFAHGTKVVCGTLIEEFLHLRQQLKDNSREMQNHLLNALVSMAERAQGAPL